MQLVTQKSALLSSLEEVLSFHRRAFLQERTFARCGWMVVASVLSFGRKTVTQLISALGCAGDDWTAFYRLFSHKRFCYDDLIACLLQSVITLVIGEGTLAFAIDVTHVCRSSNTMPGTAWGKAPRTAPFKVGIARLQRFSHLCLLTRPEDGFCRAIPLRLLLAPPPKAVESGIAPCTEWAAGLEQLNWIRSALDKIGGRLLKRRALVMMDGGYDVNGLIAGIPERVICLIRCARNRCLYEIAKAPAQRRRGAPSKYGPRAPKPSDFVAMRKGWKQDQVLVRGRLHWVRYRVEGPSLVEGAAKTPLFLIVSGGYDRVIDGKRHKKAATHYLVNAIWRDGEWRMPMTAPELLGWAHQRWEIEVAHRELKTSFGMGQAQCWGKRSAVLSVQWTAWAYAVLMIAGYHAWGGQLSGPVRSSGAWWRGSRRWSFNNLWTAYRRAFWEPEELSPVCVEKPFKPVKYPQGPPTTLAGAIATSIRG